MTNAMQAFLFAAEIFALSFAAIFLFWLAEKLRSVFLSRQVTAIPNRTHRAA
ncbi:MAG: hypothetical protein WCA28_31905 [Bradyrhizobium sp.]